ncbi:MAG: carbohydrate ABC transporter permease [Spirochaetaceae bacterium]
MALRRGSVGFLFCLPGIILLATMLLGPFLLAIGLSFTNLRLASPLPVEFVGLDNYVAVLTSSSFWTSLTNNLYFAAVVVPLQTAFALWLAILVNRPVRGVVAYRAVYFSPVVVVMTVAATVWLLLFNPERGLINGFLRTISGGHIESDWLESTTMAMPAIIIMSIWQGVGFQMIIILAGLQDIPKELYETAEIDGATRRQRFFFVTLPQLRNTLIFVATVTMILSFRLFDQVWVTTRGGPRGATRTMMIEMLTLGYERQMISRGSTVAVIFFLIVVAIAIIQRTLIREEEV